MTLTTANPITSLAPPSDERIIVCLGIGKFARPVWVGRPGLLPLRAGHRAESGPCLGSSGTVGALLPSCSIERWAFLLRRVFSSRAAATLGSGVAKCGDMTEFMAVVALPWAGRLIHGSAPNISALYMMPEWHSSLAASKLSTPMVRTHRCILQRHRSVRPLLGRQTPNRAGMPGAPLNGSGKVPQVLWGSPGMV